MFPQLQVPSNFKFKYFFSGQIPIEALTIDESISFYVLEFSHMGEQRN
jgi:hypothetical protein